MILIGGYGTFTFLEIIVADDLALLESGVIIGWVDSANPTLVQSFKKKKFKAKSKTDSG